MPMLAEVVDAVVGGDTHRDTHALELTAPSGAAIATLMIGNDARGFTNAIACVAGNSPQQDSDDQSAARVAAHRQRRRPSTVPRRADPGPARCHHAPPRRSARDREQAVRRAEARRLARAIGGIDRELADDKCHLADLVTHLAPQLVAKRGVGPVSATQAIVSWSHPGRCRDDAAYAALADASPIPASSGRIVRHRLNRGGDRHLNRALHDILLTRWRTCQRTRASIARRRPEGKTDPEIRRCLKRYIARELYRCLTTAMAA